MKVDIMYVSYWDNDIANELIMLYDTYWDDDNDISSLSVYDIFYVLGFYHWVATHINRKIFPQILWDSWAFIQGLSFDNRIKVGTMLWLNSLSQAFLHLD